MDLSDYDKQVLFETRGVSGDSAHHIAQDIVMGVTPTNSTLYYGPHELRVRALMEKWWAQERQKHPGSIMECKE
jgi:hypothetical protein